MTQTANATIATADIATTAIAATTDERFSIFPCGWWDEAEQRAKPQQRPQQTQTVGWVADYIRSERARWATLALRSMLDTTTAREQQQFKALHFEAATFSASFSYRNHRSLLRRTPFIVLDLDHLGSTAEARR